jgi:hypothetical protein
LPSESYRSAAARYLAKRQATHQEAMRRLPSLFRVVRPDLVGVPLRLAMIDAWALHAWENQWKPSFRGGDGGWDWHSERFGCENAPARFEVAVWSGDALCGLGIGKPSKASTFLSVNLLEGSPVPDHPLKGAIRYCVVEAALAYAEGLGCQELRLIQPLPGAIRLYADMGFSLAPPQENPPYCFLRIVP